MSEDKDVHCTVIISNSDNELIKRSMKESKRSKTAEAELRLADHINRYSSIEKVGKATKRNE
ncbi:TraY domain-containing protein [uncultured Shewanella sp.]|uniref:TraY domain-containing protein n=1 Tax=uncultured Shewanella sp. TaxID=173975 RepID=UPI0026395940|nr:TraY domain-containing protein [uncultured Shewanella sp.]